MEVEYELTPEDLIAFQRYHRQNSPQQPQQGGPANVFVWIVTFIASLTAALFFFFSDNPIAAWYLMMVPYVLLGAGLGVLGVILYARLTTPRLLFRALKQGRNAEKFLGWRRVFLDAEAVRNTSQFAASTYLWHGIDKVGAMLDHAFFYINTTTAIVVPNRAFSDDRAFKEFVDTARSYYRMGGDVPGAVGWERPRPTGVVPPADPRGSAPEDGIVPGRP